MSYATNSFEEKSYPADAWDLLSPKLTEQRRQRMLRTATQRTRHVRMVLQDVFDPHNVGACMRSAEAFGILCADQINLYQKFGKASTVSRGAEQWLELRRFNDFHYYIEQIKARGFKFAAAYPSADCMPLEALPLDAPLAIVFGNEKRGLHKAWTEHVDYRFTIPMFGMVESFNISVSVALTLHSLSQRLRHDFPPEKILLSAEQRQSLLNQWICRHSHDPEPELQRLRARHR